MGMSIMTGRNSVDRRRQRQYNDLSTLLTGLSESELLAFSRWFFTGSPQAQAVYSGASRPVGLKFLAER
jgi:hypothetical protein